MASKSINTLITLRTGTTSQWASSSSVVLLKGEAGVEILANGKKKLKIGDGASTWAELAYFGSTEVVTNSTAPTTSSIGYGKGAMWITDGGLIFICIADGATATWVQLGTSEDANTTYDIAAASSSGNAQIKLTGSDGTNDVVTLSGAGGTTLSVNGNTITITSADTDTGATSVEVTGAGNVVNGASYSAANRKLTLTKGVTALTSETQLSESESVDTSTTLSGIKLLAGTDPLAVSNHAITTKYRKLVAGSNATIAADASGNITISSPSLSSSDAAGAVANPLITGLAVSGHAITLTKNIGYTTSAPTAASTDTTIPTSKAVATAIGTAIAANDAMTYRGTLGASGDYAMLPDNNVKVGDVYKVVNSGTYGGITASLGDIIIAKSSLPSWDLIPSGDDGNVYHSASLTANQLIVGNTGDDVKTFANGGANQFLAMNAAGTGIKWNAITGAGILTVTPTDSGLTLSVSAEATTGAAGLMSAADKVKLNGIAANANNYTLPAASSALGGIKTGYTQSGRNYPIQLDDNDKAFVNVPWTDSNTTYSAGTDLALSGTTFNVNYTKNNLSSKLNADSDVLILNGGNPDGTWS